MDREPPPRPTVLVVDSDPRRGASIARCLGSGGYGVIGASSVSEAREVCRGRAPRALVLEQRLRDGTALDVIEQTLGAHRPFVIVHGDWTAESLPQRPPGVDVYLTQPLLDRDVWTLLRAYVPVTPSCSLPSIRRGDHLMMVYDDRAQRLDCLAMFVDCGLREAERCVIACEDSAAVGECRAHFERSGIDVDRAERSRALVLVTHDESYLVGGRFAPGLMLGFVRDLVGGTIGDGFTGLRAAGEGSWVPATPEDREAWFHWETAVQTLFDSQPLTGLCLYDRSRFRTEDLLEAIRTHPVLLDGGVVCENRFYHQRMPRLPDPGRELDRRLATMRLARRPPA